MKQNSIQKDLNDAVENLLNISRALTFNKISDNCIYIISEIDNTDHNSSQQKNIRINLNKIKTPKSIIEISKDIDKLFENLYDTNLYVYKAEKDFTLIEIQLYLKSSLHADFRKKVDNVEPMLHCKVNTPPYYSENKEKFDIHWQFGTLNHKWKMFWWRIKHNTLRVRDISRST